MQPYTRQHRLAALAACEVYLVTDARRHLDPPTAPFHALRTLAAQAAAGGAGIIQVRDKNSPATATHGPLEAQGELAALAAVREAAPECLLAVNDRADLAVCAGADVLHLGQRDLSPAAARRIVGPGVLIGRSCHSPEDVDAAIADPEVDYFCTGPVWATPTKPGRQAVGLELVSYAAQQGADTPFFAIGGIDPTTVAAVWEAGASKVVAVRAITEAVDPQAAVRALRRSVAAAPATPGQTPATADSPPRPR